MLHLIIVLISSRTYNHHTKFSFRFNSRFMVKTERISAVYNILERMVNMDQIKIGKFIAELRHRACMTQEALGQKIGVTNKTISRWETGTYMPDIEMLKLLSEIFDVSINELLSGEQLTDVNFREKADINIISAFKENSFSLKERTAFWKHKWIKDHIALIVICSVIVIGLFGWAWYAGFAWAAGLCPFLCVIIYVILQNRMMVYIEDRIYGQNNSAK